VVILTTHQQTLTPLFTIFTLLNLLLPYILSHLLTKYYAPTAQQYQLIRSFSLLLLGMFLSSLATLNFSLALIVGVLSTPLTFMQPWPNSPAIRVSCTVLLNAIAPTAVLVSSAAFWSLDIGVVLREAAFAWDVYGMYSSVVVWCVWWPAWLAGSVTVLGRPRPEGRVKDKTV